MIILSFVGGEASQPRQLHVHGLKERVAALEAELENSLESYKEVTRQRDIIREQVSLIVAGLGLLWVLILNV